MNNTILAGELDSNLFQSALPIDAKLDRARIQLLDLSARNRLLNIPRGKARSGSLIEIVDERSSEVYRIIVKEAKSLTFLAGRVAAGEPGVADDADEVAELAQPDDDGTDPRGIANRHTDNRLQTRLTSKGLQKRLLTLYFDARTLEEEQGVNVLYLGLGTLKWIDPNNATNVRYAPLVLVPVALERATAGDRFKLRWRQEDPSSNLSLEAMVDRIHLLKLPAFEPSDEFDLSAYCNAVAGAVASKPGWEVAPDDIVLGFFSFSKFLMYRDLSPETWPASNSLSTQPLIRALLRDGFPVRPPSVPDDASIDQALPPESMLHIVDCDSSQTLAVHEARLGHNLIIQGPPGTGKSQTIANIIAGAIADGKTVLFVAEKMAALEVVKRRLDAVGVGDACLELHSNKANKRLLLDELRRTWELGSPRGAFASTLTGRLTAARDTLNDHVARLHQEHAVAGITPFDVVGQLLRLRDAGQPPNDLSLEGSVTWTVDEFAVRKSLLAELRDRVTLIGQPSLHPWNGVGLDAILPPELERLLDRISALGKRLADLVDQLLECSEILGRGAPGCFADLEALHVLAQRIASAPALEGEALGHDVWTRERPVLHSLLAAGTQLRAVTETLRGKVNADALRVPVEEALATLKTLPKNYPSDAFKRCESLAELLPKLISESSRLKSQLGLDETVDTLTSLSRAVLTGQRVAAAPDASPEVFAAAIWDTGVEQAAELAEAVAKVEASRSAVGDQILPIAWTTETKSERQMLRLKGGRFLRFFSGEWRRANALLRSLVRDSKQPPNSLLNLLDTVAEGQIALQMVRDGDALGRVAFGVDWHAERSRSGPLIALVAWMRSLRGLGAAPRLIASKLPDRSEIGTRASLVHHYLIGEVRPLLDALWVDLDANANHAFDGAAAVSTVRLDALLERVMQVAKCDGITQRVLTGNDANATERGDLLGQVRNAQSWVQELQRNELLGRTALGSWWLGPRSNWAACTGVAAWIDANADIRDLTAGFADRGTPLSNTTRISSSASAWRSEFNALLADLQTDVRTLFSTASIDVTTLANLSERLSLWTEHSEQLSKWTAYRDRAQRARSLGLSDVVTRLNAGTLVPADTVHAFEMAYFEALLNDMVKHDRNLARFDGELHGRTVREFSELDRERISASRVEVVQAHHKRLPPRHGGVGPLGILRAEIARRRGLMPIRQLMQKAAPAVQALKPVLMMSPLSVAQFLPAGQLTFDLLVMDEASQIQPVDALGAIARCRQVVVVGDERQLPPTRFFSKVTDGDGEDDDEGAQVSDIESILGLFGARGLQQRMLRWHYRSRHQSLIAVSNSQFYENKLIIVPSPYTAEAGTGLSFHYLPGGIFDTGGTGANAIEAAEVANAIVRHARAYPAQTLGVATFSVRQRRAILDQLEVLRRLSPDTEAFFHAHPSEPFFVKNLENVQGDERDVIFISVGYGKNAQGAMSMRFGPLGNDGGERRLNVLISRAKLRCEVFSSITDDDIDLESARGKGIVAFKLFLRFARTGRMDLAGAESAGAPDLFESLIAAALHARGYQVHPRVGIAGLFIDLAVSDPAHPGRYLLGIECDGRSYRVARSARDRDRLRRAVLEDHGWAMHRIWSFDWFHRPNEEMARLIAAIEAAKRELVVGMNESHRHQRVVPIEVVAIDRGDATGTGLESASERSDVVVYVEASVPALSAYPDIPSVPTPMLGVLVEAIVAVEGPVHLDVVVQRLRDAWGIQRAGSRIQAAVEKAAQFSVRSRRLIERNNFLSDVHAKVVVRDRTAATSSIVRKPEMIPPEEILEAVVQIVTVNLGVQRSEVASAVSRLLGFGSTTAAWRQLTAIQVEEAQLTGRIEREGEMLILPKGV